MLIVIVLALLIGGYYGVRALTANTNGQLKASGTIETVNVDVSPELAGKVKEVQVDEGQTVKAGDVLLVLDDALLQEQIKAAAAGAQAAKSAALTAQSAYASAQAQYQIALTTARTQARSTRLKDWLGQTPDYFDQPKWYFTQDEQILAAQTEVDSALANLTTSQNALDQAMADAGNADFVKAEERLSNARATYLVALQVNSEGQATGAGLAPDQLQKSILPDFTSYTLRIKIKQNLPNNADISYAAQSAHDAASTQLTDAQNAYNALLTSASAQKILKAKAILSVAQERVQVAQDRLNSLQTGDQSQQVVAATSVLDQAKSGAQQSMDASAQAQANLDLLNAQLAKLTVIAPQDGVILSRNVEPGEYVQPGAAALTMGNLSQLTITVYVPEDRYGKIHLGQEASVSVDSFPGVKFNGKVSYISDQAEFTPRNVQTVEGRSSTVYAVKLQVNDPQGRLKPGMPADVIFVP